MRKINIFGLFFVTLLTMLGACQKDEIIFDSELPRFETRPGYQLLEVIVPQSTKASDKIYIAGEFNGGIEEAKKDPRWQLQKAPDTDVKWGIYINPADCINGKTLADGYTFVNVEQGEERSLDNKPVVHTEVPALGGRENVLVYRWADYFNTPADPGEIVHDGYVIYVVDNSELDDLHLYAWGDAEAFGGWPGIAPTGKVTIEGVNYKYFDTGVANEGLNINLIFNFDGGTKQAPDYNVTLNEDIYLSLAATEVVPFDPSAVISHDGYTVYVADYTGWDALYLYMWGGINDLNGAWPGMSPTGTQVINGVKYTYFDLGAANSNLEGDPQHVILNNGNGKQIDDVVIFNIDRDVYIELTATGSKEIDPNDYTPGGIVIPDPTPEQPEEDFTIYIANQTNWKPLYVYAYGDKEMFGAWPGQTSSETKTIDGVEYMVFNVKGNGNTENLIFNDGVGGEGGQYDALSITVDKDYYIIALPDKAELK